MNKYYKAVLLLILFPMISIAGGPITGKYSKERTEKYSFDNLKEETLIKLSNKYGNIDIQTTNKNNCTVEVNIKVSGDDSEYVQDKLDAISIVFEESPQEISAKTIIEDIRKPWSFFGSSGSIDMQIDYIVYLPIQNPININNKYGNIYLDETNGETSIECKYGNLDIGNLNHPNNNIEIDYVDEATFDFINKGEIDADYSKIEIKKSSKINLNTDYTSTEFDIIEKLNFDCDYGSLVIENGFDLEGNTDYTKIKIYQTNGLKLEADYGSLRIEELNSNFHKLDLDLGYTGARIGYFRNSNFTIEAELSYANLKYDSGNFNFSKIHEKSTKKYYFGTHGTTVKNNKKIDIVSKYGSITLNEI